MTPEELLEKIRNHIQATSAGTTWGDQALLALIRSYGKERESSGLEQARELAHNEQDQHLTLGDYRVKVACDNILAAIDRLIEGLQGKSKAEAKIEAKTEPKTEPRTALVGTLLLSGAVDQMGRVYDAKVLSQIVARGRLPKGVQELHLTTTPAPPPEPEGDFIRCFWDYVRRIESGEIKTAGLTTALVHPDKPEVCVELYRRGA